MEREVGGEKRRRIERGGWRERERQKEEFRQGRQDGRVRIRRRERKVRTQEIFRLEQTASG